MADYSEEGYAALEKALKKSQGTEAEKEKKLREYKRVLKVKAQMALLTAKNELREAQQKAKELRESARRGANSKISCEHLIHYCLSSRCHAFPSGWWSQI